MRIERTCAAEETLSIYSPVRIFCGLLGILPIGIASAVHWSGIQKLSSVCKDSDKITDIEFVSRIHWVNYLLQVTIDRLLDYSRVLLRAITHNVAIWIVFVFFSHIAINIYTYPWESEWIICRKQKTYHLIVWQYPFYSLRIRSN